MIFEPFVLFLTLFFPTFGLYSYFNTFVPFFLSSSTFLVTIVTQRTLAILFSIVSLWIYVNVIYNYLVAAFLNPGYDTHKEPHEMIIDSNPPKESVDLNIGPTTVTFSADSFIGSLFVPTKYCVQCEHYKRDRVHHCQACRKCVYYMDHHCPYTNNCVGRRNYLYFYLFICYLSIGTMWAQLISLPLFLRCFSFANFRAGVTALTAVTSTVDAKCARIDPLETMCFPLLCFASISIYLLWFSQTVLLLKNKTLLELLMDVTQRNWDEVRHVADIKEIFDVTDEDVAEWELKMKKNKDGSAAGNRRYLAAWWYKIKKRSKNRFPVQGWADVLLPIPPNRVLNKLK